MDRDGCRTRRQGLCGEWPGSTSSDLGSETPDGVACGSETSPDPPLVLGLGWTLHSTSPLTRGGRSLLPKVLPEPNRESHCAVPFPRFKPIAGNRTLASTSRPRTRRHGGGGVTGTVVEAIGKPLRKSGCGCYWKSRSVSIRSSSWATRTACADARDMDLDCGWVRHCRMLHVTHGIVIPADGSLRTTISEVACEYPARFADATCLPGTHLPLHTSPVLDPPQTVAIINGVAGLREPFAERPAHPRRHRLTTPHREATVSTARTGSCRPRLVDRWNRLSPCAARICAIVNQG